ncbi:patatin-like phospholipase family protein [Candidatus Omnitrophota bacterium]
MSPCKKTISILFLVAVVCFLGGCGSMRHAVPSGLEASAFIPGMREVRAFGDAPDKSFINDLNESFKQESPNEYRKGALTVYPVLLVSGGGANGAYGAGILNGWSESGSRPKFKTVTGVSTGALIAPFAFLGSDYDDKLKDLYTKMSTKDVARSKGPLAPLTSDSLESTRPLMRIIKKYYTKDVLKKIADEYKKGRRLYIGTTNLDAQRLVVWNMGKIAQIGDKESLKLFHKVLLASSAIPIAFPPVFFKVEADGKKYDEMHVDGGTVTQVFTLHGILQGTRRNKAVETYLIWNGFVNPKWKSVKDNLSSIASRSVNTMINYQGLGDIFRLYILSGQKKHDFHLAYIPTDFEPKSTQMFDPVEMKKLFDLGYEKAAAGTAWQKKPPVFEIYEKDKDKGGI